MTQHKLRFLFTLLLGVIALPAQLRAGDDASLGSGSYGKSRFSDIPLFAINRPVQSDQFPIERRNYRECGIGGAFQIAGYYTQNTKGDEDDRASYFLPNGKAEIIVSEQNSDDYLNFRQDVFAQYFKVATGPLAGMGTPEDQTYSSLVHLAPKTQVAGIGLQYIQSIRCFWFDLTMPIQYVSTSLGITETQRQAGNAGAAVAVPAGWYGSVIESWQSGDLSYGRFLPDLSAGAVLPSGIRVQNANDPLKAKISRWGVGDLDIRAGWQALESERLYGSGYIGVVVPTAKKYNPTFLWDPQLGYGHFGVMWGSSINMQMREFCNGGELRWMLNINNRFLFENRQLRSLDLKGKEWSRYEQAWSSIDAFVANDSATLAAANQPLINYSTLQCKVRPRSQLDINTAFVYNRCWFAAELGFNAYARHAEELILDDTIQANIGVADVQDVALVLANGPWTIEQFGYIRGYIRPGTPNLPGGNAIPDTDPTGVETYIPVTNADLDLLTASAPGVLAYSVYGSLGVDKRDAKRPWFASVGGLFTFASDNTVVQRWGVFAKVGMSI